MKTSDCFITMFLFCIVNKGTSFGSQNLDAIDDPDPAGQECVKKQKVTIKSVSLHYRAIYFYYITNPRTPLQALTC